MNKSKTKEQTKERKTKEQTKERKIKTENTHIFKIETLYKSITINKYFFIVLIVSLLVYCYKKKKSFTSSLISFILITFIGYLAHVISHSINTNEIFNRLENKTFFTSNKYTKPLIKKTCDFFDFHDIVHHNTTINKQPLNIFYEVVNNFLMQGGLVYAFYILSRYLEPEMFILWAFMYTSIHHINYSIIGSKEHKEHHANKHVNYGLDIWDVIFNTKPNPIDEDGDKPKVSYTKGGPEDFNHIIFNLLVGLAILYFIF